MIEMPTIREDHACVGCGYNLRGLPFDHRCPECGKPCAESVRFVVKFVPVTDEEMAFKSTAPF